MKNKVRVLHIIPDFGSGGAERLLVDLLQATDTDRFEVAAVSLYPRRGTILDKEINDKELKVFYLNKRLGLDIRVIFEVHRLFRNFRPDVIHTHLSVLHYTLIPTTLLRVGARIHTIHNTAQKETDRFGKIVRFIAFYLCHTLPVSLSQQVANSVREVYGRYLSTPIIFNGIPTLRYLHQFSENQSEPVLNDDFVLIHIGRFVPQKNHKLLVESFAKALNVYPKMRLLLVGEGPLRPQTEQIVENLKLTNKVMFLGVRKDIPELLAKSDAFVLSSDWEGMPLTILEAMAAGKPVVSTSVGAVPEIVMNGITGILVSPQDSKLFSDGLLKLTKDTGLCAKMGNSGRQRVLEQYDISRTAREYESIYLKQLKRLIMKGFEQS